MAFASREEFRAVIDQLFSMMSTDAVMGPRLRDAETANRYFYAALVLRDYPHLAG